MILERSSSRWSAHYRGTKENLSSIPPLDQDDVRIVFVYEGSVLESQSSQLGFGVYFSIDPLLVPFLNDSAKLGLEVLSLLTSKMGLG